MQAEWGLPGTCLVSNAEHLARWTHIMLLSGRWWWKLSSPAAVPFSRLSLLPNLAAPARISGVCAALIASASRDAVSCSTGIGRGPAPALCTAFPHKLHAGQCLVLRCYAPLVPGEGYDDRWKTLSEARRCGARSLRASGKCTAPSAYLHDGTQPIPFLPQIPSCAEEVLLTQLR